MFNIISTPYAAPEGKYAYLRTPRLEGPARGHYAELQQHQVDMMTQQGMHDRIREMDRGIDQYLLQTVEIDLTTGWVGMMPEKVIYGAAYPILANIVGTNWSASRMEELEYAINHGPFDHLRQLFEWEGVLHWPHGLEFRGSLELVEKDSLNLSADREVQTWLKRRQQKILWMQRRQQLVTDGKES